MGDGGSQSPITLKLNYLAGRRLSRPEVMQEILNRLIDPKTSLVDIASSPLAGVIIARRQKEKDHITEWPPEQLAFFRAVVTEAVRQNRQVAYDWEPMDVTSPEPAYAISMKDDGLIIGFTFKSKPG